MNRIIKTIIIPFLFATIMAANCEGQFSFVHLSDIHVSDGVSLTNDCDTNGVIFAQMLATINNLDPKPVFVVASGDISNMGSGGGDGMYSNLTQYLFPSSLINPGAGDYYIDAAQTIPIYFVPGNHDYFTMLIPPLSSPDLVNYEMYLAPDTDYTITFNNALVIFLRSGYDVYRPIWEDWNPLEPEGSGLTDDQCNWLRSILAANPDKKKIIVMHHPPVAANGTNWDGTPNTGTILDTADGSIMYNRTVFLNICDSNHVDVVLAGHNHQSLVASRPGNVVDENWTGGTRYIQTATCLFNGYRIITVDSSFVWAGTTQLSTPLNISEDKLVNGVNPLKVYFDPSLKILTISCRSISDMDNAKFTLYNIAGQSIIDRKLTVHNNEPITTSTADIPGGLYLVSLRTGMKLFSEKVMIY
jgi:3',5'-cyclic AMP phosphodiesterase CpdA